MDPERLRQLLERVQSGDLAVATALSELETLPFADLGYARVDHHRELRQGLPEVVLAPGKSPEQMAGIAEEIARREQNVLITRLAEEPARELLSRSPALEYVPRARLARMLRRPVVRQPGAPVPVVTAGTSDIVVAEEAIETLALCGIEAVRLFDVGVAGIHRLLPHVEGLRAAPAIIVIAGMEGALASVVGGLVAAPVVAVPTSVGYGVSLGGLTALFGMLTSCAAGITVVNIDNGFGAAMAVARLLLPRNRAEET